LTAIRRYFAHAVLNGEGRVTRPDGARLHAVRAMLRLGGTVLAAIPLFAGYVFVRTGSSRTARLGILQTTGVIGFVGSHGEGTPVPSEQVEHLRRLLQQRVACSLHAFLKVGRRVRVRGGCLDGVEGILAESGEKSLVISIDCIQRSLLVRLEGYELELV